MTASGASAHTQQCTSPVLLMHRHAQWLQRQPGQELIRAMYGFRPHKRHRKAPSITQYQSYSYFLTQLKGPRGSRPRQPPHERRDRLLERRHARRQVGIRRLGLARRVYDRRRGRARFDERVRGPAERPLRRRLLRLF